MYVRLNIERNADIRLLQKKGQCTGHKRFTMAHYNSSSLIMWLHIYFMVSVLFAVVCEQAS